MYRQYVILIFFSALINTRAFSQDYDQQQILRDEIREYAQATVSIHYTGRQSLDYLSDHLSVISVRDNEVIISLSPLTAEWFIEQNVDFEIIRKPALKDITTAVNKDIATDWQSYPSYDDYVLIMKDFQTNYPSLCNLDTIGTSVENRLVLVLKISDNVNTDETEPEVFYTSTMHGDETGGFMLLLRLADSLLKGYPASQRIKNLVNNLEIWINPLANPDGAYRNGGVISSSSTRYNANGVDLNRNFPDPTQSAKVYEKETVDMVRFLKDRRFVISANFHSGAEVLNYPWDKWLSIYHADNDWFYQVCRVYADTVHSYSQGGYLDDYDNGVVRGAVWYVIKGGRQDYITYELQGREVTMEIDYDYITPAAQLELLWLYNKRSLIKYLENAFFGIHGYVKAEGTSAPVAARIFIEGHDKDSSHVYSDTLTGVFTRLIAPGTWSLTFSANGFRDTVLNNIVVEAGQRTDLTVFMNPITTGLARLVKNAPQIWPNPARDKISCRLPEDADGQVSIFITDNAGRVLTDYFINHSKGSIVEVDISSLTEGSYIISFRNRKTGLLYTARFIAGK